MREVNDVKDERVQKFEWLSVEDVRAVLEKTSCSRNPVRDRFMLSLMYESGARVAEVLSLKVGDISPAKGGGADVRIFGKAPNRASPLSLRRYGGSIANTVRAIIQIRTLKNRSSTRSGAACAIVCRQTT